MPKNCIVPFCRNRGKIPGIKYYRITSRRRESWLKALGRNPDDNICRDSFVCSHHFQQDQVSEDGCLLPLAIPSLNLRPSKCEWNITRESENITASSSNRPILAERNILLYPSTSNCDLVNESRGDKPNFSAEDKTLNVSEGVGRSSSTSSKCARVSLQKEKSKRKLEEAYTSSTSADSVGLTGNMKKRRKIIKQEHTYSTSPKKMKESLLASAEKKKIMQRRLRNANLKVSRLRDKVVHLNDIVQNLKHNHVLSKEATIVLEKTYSGIPLELMKRLMTNLQKGKVSRQSFPEELKCFALTLQFYSNKAYNYVREVFKLALPSPSTLRNWVNNVDSKPGFCNSSFDVLKETCAKSVAEGKTVFCSLMLDEMAIKKQIDFVSQSQWGYVNLGTGLQDDSLECATEVLVLMVTAINSNWKVPIAYFFIKGLSGAEKASIVTEALIRLHQIDIKIVSLTFDGPSAHFTMATELGAEIDDLQNIRPYFSHPVDESKIYAIFDACHMLKLLRNNWATCGKFIDMWENFVDFSYITRLYNLQDKEMLHLANKLRKAHIEWQRQKMKVNIAAQTISKSVADALQFLMDDLKHPDFLGAEGTIKFLRLMDSTFDLLNSRNIFGKGCKTPLKQCNENYWSPILTEAIQYLLNIKNMEGTYLVNTRNKTPFRGFIITIKSLVGLYNDYVKNENAPLKYLLTYKVSQDHLELFFCQIRSRNGWNNNPTAFQFYCTFKRLLLKNNIKNLKGNCLVQDETHLLNYKPSSNKENITIDDISVIKKYNIDITESQIGDHEYCLPKNPKFNIVAENVVGYVAGFVVKLVKKHIKCNICILSIEDYHGSVDDSLMFYNAKNRGGLIAPKADVIYILRKVEIQIRNILSVTDNRLPREDGFINVLTNILGNQILSEGKSFLHLQEHMNETSSEEENHVYRLVKNIIFVYLKVRFHAIAKKYTETVRGELIRKKLNKIILYSHQ